MEKLDSIKTVDCLSDEKRQLVLQNALELYAPLAEQIGLFVLKSDIEDETFKKLDPLNYERLQHILDTHPVTNDEYIKEVSEIIKDLITEEKIKIIDYYGRKKRPYSFYNKVIRYVEKFNGSQEEAIEKIHDKVGFRIIL